MRLTPDRAVMPWFSVQDLAELCLTAVTEAELRTGAAMLPPGQHRDRLAAKVDAIVWEVFTGWVLPFDSPAAKVYAVIAAAAVATRNSADFEHCGIPLIGPWTGNCAST
ncbi:MAG: VapC toxin family PIN domain ribonuclease [Aphanocapsa feldmannii 277cV]|uniref:VapC toxin family PIN domain ribonuclease n=2 Tax=Aphanocapsa feldmannii TaxID=192050 RepID=A0A524RMA5_9CHRO|nr:MAG: VapC toxin family PIN domain ribonuclease [Aphanocapsa feldmannii 277cV]TGH20876.1 MAG: VapC toxin family PIN domain ribonuclease [Aphanocapsa feldmannii 277cI]